MTEQLRAASDYTRSFWAKAHPYRQRRPDRIHLLEHHLADVGATFEALISQPTIRNRLAQSGGLDALDDSTAARLALFAALHDIGKVNVGFQTQIWEDSDFADGARRPPHAGHYRELAPVLMGTDSKTAAWFFKALGWWEEATTTWDKREGETVCALFIAALSHHGQPFQLEGGPRPENPTLWQQHGNLIPADYVRRIGSLARLWFPAAFDNGAPKLPSKPEFQHHFLGLCILADWIGSNMDWFPYVSAPLADYFEVARERARKAIRDIGLDVSKQRQALGHDLPEFYELFGGSPYAIQQAAVKAPLDEQLVIVESETGSGKTEAVLWRFAMMYREGFVDGLYFALPTRAAASQLQQRVTTFVARLFSPDVRPETILAVPGYLKAGEVTGKNLDSYKVLWDDEPDMDKRGRRWAAEGAKRYLAAQIAVGTVDQAMMAALKVKHAHLRAASLARNLLIVDEVHASDPYMRRIVRALLDSHMDAGGYAVLMSATLGSVARRQWLSNGRIGAAERQPLQEAIDAAYPAISTRSNDGELITAAGENQREKAVGMTVLPYLEEPDQVAKLALKAAHSGAKVLVIRNTVSAAIDTQLALEEVAADDREAFFALGGAPTLHHGRFAVDDRRALDAEIERRLGKNGSAGGLVVVGTQTLEQSLDIDADLLITDLCPADVLLQRIGRLHRRRRDNRPAAYSSPTCIVLAPDGGNLSSLLARRTGNRTGLGPSGSVYPDLRILEATQRLATQHTHWEIPRMNRELVEGATHPDALEAITNEMGDEWRVHAIEMEGGQIAEGLTAAGAILRRDKSFFSDNRDVLFGANEEHIRTRLGDEGIEIEFAPPAQSPFDQARQIDTLTIPAHLLRGAYAEAPITPVAADSGFTFEVGGQEFCYDRLGLRRAE